jgi:hypothetical protein
MNNKTLVGISILCISFLLIGFPESVLGQVTFEEIETGGTGASGDPTTVTTSASLTAVNNHLYVASIVTKPYHSSISVDSVYGLGLTWTQVKSQCAGQSLQYIEVWWALGSPSGDGTVSADVSNPSSQLKNVALVVARYSGADTLDPIGNYISKNTNGVNGSCSGGTSSDVYTVNLTTTAPLSTAFGAVAIRSVSHTPGTGFTERAEIHEGGGAHAAGLAVEDSSMTSEGTLTVGGSLGGSTDWAVIAVELKENNDAPTVASAIPDTTVVRNNPSIDDYRDLNNVFTDSEDGGALSFTIESNSDSALVQATIDTFSALDFSFGADLTGNATIVIRATDSGSLYVEDTFVVTVVVPDPDLQLIHFRWRNDDGLENEKPDSFEVRITSSNDDAEQDSSGGNMHLNSSDLEMVMETELQRVGLRFQNVTVPQGANITNAFIEFIVDETTSVATDLTFWGEDTNSATTFTSTAYDIDDRNWTSTSVDWDNVPPWDVDDDTVQTPDISSIVQVIVNRSGWSSGNDMAIFVTGSGVRIARAYDGTASKAPLIHIEYQTSTGASWAADEDSILTEVEKDSLMRLRIEISNEGTTSDGGGTTYRLEVSEPNPSSGSTATYTEVPTDTSGHWQIFDSGWLMEGNPTTNVSLGLTDENPSFKAGEIKDSINPTSSIILTNTEFTEIEYALKPTSNAEDGALYCFRLTKAGDTTDFTYSQYAKGIVAGVGLSDISVDTTNEQVTLLWTSVPGTIYDIYYADSLEGTYTDIDDDTALGYSNTWTDDGTKTPSHPDSVIERYYRIQKQGGSVSTNTVGKYTVTLVDSVMNLNSIPFVPYSTDLDTVIGHKLTGASSELNADRIWKWDTTSTSLQIAWLVSGGPQDGKWWDTENNQESTITLDADEGFWIQNRHIIQKLTFVGEVSDLPNRTINLAYGMNLIGSAYPVSVALDSSDLWEDGATGDINELNADRVWVWDPITETYKFAWLIDGLGPPWDGKWWDSETGAETTIRLEPGIGLWIEIRPLPGHAPFVWTYPKPYTNPPN